MMIQITKEEFELYKKLDKATDKKEIDKINAELTRIALEEKKIYEHLPFA